jgi:hypothetical protein
MDTQWMESRRAVIDARLHALDFYGFALENTPLREKFWPAYELLAETIFSLRQAILACVEARDTRDTLHSAYRANCLKMAQRHINDAALQLFKLAQDGLVRRSVEERGPGLAWLDQLDPSRLAANLGGGLEVAWDESLSVYDVLFERVRLAAIAEPTGEMDQ